MFFDLSLSLSPYLGQLCLWRPLVKEGRSCQGSECYDHSGLWDCCKFDDKVGSHVMGSLVPGPWLHWFHARFVVNTSTMF